MNNVTINLENLSDSDRETVMAIREKACAPKVAGFRGVQDGETFMLAGMEFIKFPDVHGQTPIVMRNIAFDSRFGDNNDLRGSDVLKRLQDEILPKVIAAAGEENVCTFKTDLTTLDGLKPYEALESRIGLPPFEFYRAHVESFDRYPVDGWWWLATPESAQPHDAPEWVTCVSPSGFVYFDYCGIDGIGARPFLILKSTIFESSEE